MDNYKEGVELIINNIKVELQGDPITEEELKIYLEQLQAKNKHQIIRATVTVDGEFVDVEYKTKPVNFDRIRRITGYLVGTTARWNNAKQSELKDRTKHC